MQTVTSRDVQSRYGDFVESLQDDLVCVTRHGRPLFWAVSDRQVRAEDPSVFIGRLLLLRGQLHPDTSERPGTDFAALLDRLDGSINSEGLTEADVMTIVHDNRI